jgi:Flp pilus assembly protein TadD
MSIVTAVVLSMLLLTVTGCATSSDPSAAKQETGKKDFRAFRARVLGSSPSRLTTSYCRQNLQNNFQVFPLA